MCLLCVGLRIKETKEVYEGEVTELTPCETENPLGGKISKSYFLSLTQSIVVNPKHYSVYFSIVIQ